jgi:hypothetical protein
MDVCQNARMDSGDWRRADELAPAPPEDWTGEANGRDDRPTEAPRRVLALAGAVRDWRQYASRHGRRSAAIGLVVVFVLLLCSQWVPWADVEPIGGGAGGQATNGQLGSAFTVGIDDGATTLVLTYYLLWVIVLALAGATVFANGRVRQPLFGATVGATVVQFVAILPLLRHPKGLVGNVSDVASFGDATELVVTRQPGMYLAVVALIVLAGSMALAVEGNVFPSLAPESAAEPEAGTALRRPDRTTDGIEIDVISEALPVEPVSPPPVGPAPVPEPPRQSPGPHGYPGVSAFTVGGVEPADPPRPPRPSGPSDHSAYTRPLRDEDYRR